MVDGRFLVANILAVIGLLFYIIYWNRVLAVLLGFVFRIVLRNKGGSTAWIRIGSFHISLIAGRVLLKDFSYHSTNQTIKIVKVQLRWQYWIRSLTTSEAMHMHPHGGGEEPKLGNGSKSPHCRFHMTFEGFEWFIYNRTAAFDNIVSQMEARTPPSERRTQSFGTDRATFHLKQFFSRSSAAGEPNTQSSRVLTTPKLLHNFTNWLRSQLPDLDFKDLLPLGFEGLNGGIVIGNPATPNVLVAEFSRVDGMFGTVPSKSPLDLYKQLLNVKFENATINLKENDQYQAPMADIGSHLHDHLRKDQSLSLRYFRYLTYSVFSKLYRPAQLRDSLRAAAQVFKKQTAPPSPKTFRSRSKRAQNIDTEPFVGPESAKQEYAIERRVLEAPVFELSYYVDVVGVVPVESRSIDREGLDLGNGDVSPEWGLDIVVHGGFLRYGPWADRQRAELQRIFFPPTYHDAEPTRRLEHGDNRMWAAMRVFVEFRGGTTLYIPFREASKNWQWDDSVDVLRPRTREAASLSIKAGDASTISYLIPMVADTQGYHPLLDVYLDRVTVSSSLNDIRLLTTRCCKVSGKMLSPLKWDAHRQWTFNLSVDQPIFYLLRDHVNMFTDLSKDWSSGPPSNYFTWVPMLYSISVDLSDYEINTYVNDHNIIDKPLLREENALLKLCGATLRNENTIISDKFRPPWTSLPFSISAPNVTLSLTLPKWNTHCLQAEEPIIKLMTVGLLHLDGSFLSFSDVRDENVDQLKLKLTLDDVIFKCLAWSIRHFMIFQQNYFGTFTHFSTLREYLQKRDLGQIGDPIGLRYRPRMSNPMQVELRLNINHSLIILPVGLPGYETFCQSPDQLAEDVQLGGCVVLSAPEIELQLRSHHLGLEMNLNVGTVYGDIESNYTERSIFTRSQWYPSSEVFLIDGIDILADRLFGPQPQAAAYVCFWEINFGTLKGLLSTSHTRTLQSALDSFAINYKDLINTPAAEFALPPDPDVTFMRVSFTSVDLTWSVEPVSVHCFLPKGLCVALNDLSGNNYRKVTSLSIPKLILRFLHSLGERNDWVEAGEVVFDVALDSYSSPPGWQESALSQAEFLADQDGPTGRLRKLRIGLGKRGRWALPQSVHAAVLRLPRPRLAQLSTPLQDAPLVEDKLKGSILTRPMPFSHRNIISDSEDEDSYATVAHDSRLVNSRPPSMLPLPQADDETMSSGDESDDEDLTEGSSYGSDVSGWAQGGSAACEHSLALRYSRVSRRYSLSTAKPSSWDETSVASLQDRRPYSTPLHREAMSSENEHSWYKHWKADIPEDSSTSTIRALVRSIEIWVNPLLPSVIVHLLEDNSRATMSPEQHIDALATSHIRDFLKQSNAVNDSIFDVRITSVRLQVVQVVRKARDQRDGIPDVVHHYPEDEVAVVDLQAHQIGLKAQIHKEAKLSQPSFAVSVHRIGLNVDLHDMRSSANPHAVVHVSLSDITSALIHKHADLSWTALSVALEMDAAAYISEVVSAHIDPINCAISAYRRLQSQVLAGARFRVLRILQWSKGPSGVDPLSTIQPSYLIQTGRPHEIRMQAALKILFYIRDCLRFLSAEERKAIHHLIGAEDTVVTREEVVTLLEKQLAGLAVDADAANLANINLVSRIFEAPDIPRLSPTHERPMETIGIRLQATKIAVLHPAHGAPSEISFRVVEVTAALKKAGLLLASSKSSKDLISTRDKHRSVIQRVAVSVVLDGIDVLMLPHILNFAQSLVRLHKRSRNVTPILSSSSPPQPTWRTTFSVDATLSIHALRFQVAAENLIVAFVVSHLGFVSSVYARPHPNSQSRPDLSTNASLFFDSVALEARSSTDNSSASPQDILAELSVKKTGLSCAFRHESAFNPSVRGALVVGCLQLRVPRSAIRLSRFIEEWKADYLPHFEQTIHALVSELQQEPTTHPSPKSVQRRVPITNFQVSIGSCGVFLHVLPGTWLSWELIDTLAYLKLGVDTVHPRQLISLFGLRFSSQRVSIASPSGGKGLEDASEEGSLKVDLPPMTVTGTYENHGIHVLASAGFFSITVKPSYWDTLLSVQQKFGNDINDLLHVLADARAKRPPSQKPAKTPPSPSQLCLQSGAFKASGFQIGLEGHSSTLLLECQDISGCLKGGDSKGIGKFWQLDVTGLALSLVPRAYAIAKSKSGKFDGRRCSAFVVIDCKAEVDQRSTQKCLRIKVSKIHAVMQPSSIGEIGDFVDHLQVDVLGGKDERVRELATFKEKARTIMGAFGVKDRESTSHNSITWFKHYAVVFNVSDVGVAFPFALDSRTELSIRKPYQPPAIPAFLFSVKSIEFADKNTGYSQFVMKDFSFQFVDRFRQSVPEDFTGDGRRTRNRLVYPDMTAQVRTELSAKSRHIRVGANISGFILDVEPSIADHVASLIDVYRKGKERVDQFAVNAPHSTIVQDFKEGQKKVASETDETNLPTSSILLSMVFLSGKVRMHSHGVTPKTTSYYDTQHSPLPASSFESFNLPMLSVWGEYRATLASRGRAADANGEPSSLVLKSTIHSSENTLRPDLLPLMTDLVNRIERRMHKASPSNSSTRTAVSAVPPELPSSHDSLLISSLQITLALRIDQSKLQLTCQPDVNVIAGVYWDSGGFLLNVSNSGRRISFIGSVGGLTVGLKHGFLSEDCVRLDAHNLAFSTTFTGAGKSMGLDASSMSVVIDTEVSGGLRFSRFQDVLCFKAVWLDRIPVLSTSVTSEPAADNPLSTKIPPVPGAVRTKSDFTTVILVRIRRIGLDVDLGQSISSVRMDMLDVTLNSKIEEMRAELSMYIGELIMSATGNISGHARIPDFSFNTMRRKALAIDPSNLSEEPRMLDMSLRCGNLEMALESDYQKILHLWSERLDISVWDDWSQMSPQVAVLDQLQRLSFTVSGTELIAVVTVGTIPKLFSYGSRFRANLQVQREGAARESNAFRIARSPKPDNPLSAFANAMLQTARTRLREKEHNLSYVVQQRMQFSLGSLRLIVFPRTMGDNEIASFSATELRADLDLIVESSDLPAKRSLRLAFSGVSTSRVGPLSVGMIANVRTDVREWLKSLRKETSVSTIFELPAMDMEMESEETGGVLEYDFKSQFARRDTTAGRREDIFITLNVALYSWLTLLRKNLAREMNQVRDSLDRRPVAGLQTSTPSGISTPTRRRTVTESSPPDVASLSVTTDFPALPRSPRGPSRSDAAMERRHRGALSVSAMPSRTDISGVHTLSPPADLIASARDTSVPTPLLGEIVESPSNSQPPPSPIASTTSSLGHPQSLVYKPKHRRIERLHMRQLGEATPDVMHPFFTKRSGFNLEDALPQFVHEYATMPVEEIMRALLRLYTQQLSYSAPQ